MKKSTKRYLILAAVVAIVAMTMAICVSAASVSELPDWINCSTCGKQQAEFGKTQEAQCDSDGWTEIVCSKCGKVWGYTGKVEKLGHKLDNNLFEYQLSADETYFHKLLKCSREGCQYTTLEGEADEVVKYCQVNFINDFATDTYEDKNVYYATLAATYKTETDTQYIEYPATGSTEVFTKDPVRLADKTFGRYIFVGWLSENEIEKAWVSSIAVAYSLHDTAEILKNNRYFDDEKQAFIYGSEADGNSYAPLVSAAKAAKPVVDENTPAVYNLYAIFEVDTSVTHTVTFLNYDGRELYVDRSAPHALKEVDYKGATPKKPDNVEFTYEFDYWALYNTITPMGNKKTSIPPVYGDIKVIAHYDEKLRQYNFKYYQRDGVTLFEDVMDTVTLAGTGANRLTPQYGLSIDVPDYFDAKYVYEHKDNMWMIPSRGNYIVDLENIRLPEGTLDNSEVDYIALVPYYQAYLRSYKLPVSIVYEEDDNSYYHPGDITIEVRDADGRGIGYAELNQDPKYYKDGTYTIEFDVNYSANYTVTVTSEGYSGTSTTQFHEFNADDPSDDRPGNVIVILKRNIDDPCSCICHTVFKPVWVGILNLLNSLFKLEFVCCDDMFANIGSQLNYGPASTK